jgi:hypothetical protein
MTPHTKGHAATFAFWSDSLDTLATQMATGGQLPFLDLHPSPFLVFISGPKSDVNPMNMVTDITDRTDQDEPLVAKYGDYVFAIHKSDRNFDESRISVGRARSNDIVIRSPKVSKYHAAFRSEGDRFLIEDLGSANGTRVNGRPVKSGEPAEVKSGDRIHFWRYEFELLWPQAMRAVLIQHNQP